MRRPRVVVVGDAISDVYRDFSYVKDCPDAPGVPVGVQMAHEVRPGGAANVAVNLVALVPSGVAVDLVSVMDSRLGSAVNSSSSGRVCLDWSVLTSSSETLSKERVSLGGRLVARLDSRREVPASAAEWLGLELDRYLKAFPDVDLVVVSDYAGGVVTDSVMRALSPFRDRMIVDTKRTDLSQFSSGSRTPISGVPSSRTLMVKLNQDEHRQVLLGDALPERHFKYFVVTRGGGDVSMTVYRDVSDFEPNGVTFHGSISQTIRLAPIRGVDVVDVCGCGDTFLAGLAAGLLRYNDPHEALSFANAAAATVVCQPRTAVASLERTLELTGRNVSAL